MSAWAERARAASCATLLAVLAGIVGPDDARAAGPPQLEPPPPEALAEARRIVESMKANDRGPYKWIRWFCADGTVHPARPYPCQERGGGVQHAQYSDERARLAQLGWRVGTILTGTPVEELFDPERPVALADLALERYLVEVDDGWVLRRARNYRGRVQVEDEEKSGRQLLLAVLAHPGWAGRNFLLARETVRTVPHDSGTDRTRDVRRLSRDLADRDASFEALRVKLHNQPQARDASAVRKWAERPGLAADLRATALELARAVDLVFGREGRAARLDEAARSLRAVPGGADEADLLAGVMALGARERVSRLSEVAGRLRELVGSSTDAKATLAALDASLEVEDEILVAARELADARGAPVSFRLALTADLVRAAFGAGWLSAGEAAALADELAPLLAESSPSPARLMRTARSVERATAWAVQAVEHAFAESIVRHAALEPKATAFPDDLVRGSVVLALAEVAGDLARQAERDAGLRHVVFGTRVAGAAGLNPGVAVGRLRVASEADLAAGTFASGDVVVLPRTVSELSPVAGIMTLAAGNVLSHVQLLARNLGIPNAVVPESALPLLRAHAGEEVAFAVGSDGALVVAALAALDAPQRALLGAEAAPDEVVDPPAVDLSVRDLVPLAELHAGLSGKVVGPKAAHLGELARLFPGRVAPALAIPFGIHAEELSGPGSPRERLELAFARHRRGETSDAELAAEVDAVRALIEASRLSRGRQDELRRLMTELMGAPGTCGVFVRSDTNVEDLPHFTGAGLNRTVPNVVAFDDVVKAVAQVWASPFTPRAMAWRRRALTRPEDVYPSVLVMKSVPSEKSGVLVTADLVTGGRGLTVATAWGVGGAVDSEDAETLVLREDGGVTLGSEAKAPFRRTLPATGGIAWLPAPAGPVLSLEEIASLRALADELKVKLAPVAGPDGAPMPWDVEFGFVTGELALFQVRPLVERGAARADRVLRELLGGGLAAPSASTGAAVRPAAGTTGGLR